MRRVCAFAVLLPAVFGTLALAQDAKPAVKKDPDQIGNRDVSKGINFYSLDKERALGKQLAQEYEKHSVLVTDKLITEYVNQLVQKLARNSDAKLPITIKVVEGDSPNALTLPGGYIFMELGLLRTVDTESELAAALAHEIAHVAARHGTRQASDSQLAHAATIPLLLAGGIGGICFGAADRLFVPAGYMAISRGFETEADSLGLQYLYKSGYDPLGMVDFFEKLSSYDERRHGHIRNVLSTHPLAVDRLVAIQKSIETTLKERPQYVVNTSEFDNVKARLVMLDWTPAPLPPSPNTPKVPTLRRAGDQIANSKNLVPEPGAQRVPD